MAKSASTPKPKAPPVAADENGELPEGWCNSPLGNFVTSMANGIYKSEKFYAANGTPCLRMYNIQEGQVVLRNIKRMKLTPKEIEQYELLPSDILVNRVNKGW